MRASHAHNAGRLFSWNEPPVTGHPGEDFGCRCYAEPVVEEGFQIAESGEIVSDYPNQSIKPQIATEDEEYDDYAKRRYPRPKVGEKILVPDKSGNVPDRINIFIGGAGDRSAGHNVEDSHALHRDVYGENYYFTYSDSDQIKELLQNTDKKKINLIGHSWGGDTAAEIARDNAGKIDILITIDPVTTFGLKPNFEEVQESVGTWIDINATGRPNVSTDGDDAAGFGGWDDGPKNDADIYMEAPYSHENFDDMLNYKPTYNNINDILNNNKIKSSPREILNNN